MFSCMWLGLLAHKLVAKICSWYLPKRAAFQQKFADCMAFNKTLDNFNGLLIINEAFQGIQELT